MDTKGSSSNVSKDENIISDDEEVEQLEENVVQVIKRMARFCCQKIRSQRQ